MRNVTGTDQRYYAPAYGRFITPDSYGKSANPRRPGSWNRYVYASDDPVNRNDPSGKIDCESWYQWLEHYSDSIPDSSTLGNCAEGEASSSEVSFDPCSVSADVLSALDAPISCAAPPCYDASGNAACYQNGGAGAAGVAPVENTGGASPAYSVILQNAVNAAEVDLSLPTCAALFGSNSDPAFSMATASIAIAAFDDAVPSGVGAATLNGSIFVASNRYFFSGLDANGQSVLTNPSSVFNGLTYLQMRQVVLIHELLHLTGIAGADNQGQQITLGNGVTVNGSAGITKAVVQDCLQ